VEADATHTSPAREETEARNLKHSTKLKIACEQCGTTREVYPSYVKRGQMRYCSRDCFNTSRRKQEPVEFDSDLFFRNIYGYYFSKRTSRMLHRVIWEKHYGPIPEGFRVYFKDKNKDNWAVDNLYLKELNPQGGCDECGKKIYARGKCRNHYEQTRDRQRKHRSATKSLT
jgi:hypothetical protein